jgi:hypothetical protein
LNLKLNNNNINKKYNENKENIEGINDDKLFNNEKKLLQIMCDIYEIQAFSNKNFMGENPVRNLGNNIVI